jgi:predicted GNAT family acetyltransferase
MPDLHIEHLPAQQRFRVVVDGLPCVADYHLDAAQRRVVFTHTGVPAALQGRGIAAMLVQAALDWAAAEQLQVVPACSYVAVYMRRHPETLALLDPRG